MSLEIDKSTWQQVRFGDVVHNVNNTVKDAAAAAIDRVIAMEHMDPGELKIERWGKAANGTTFTRRVHPKQTLFGKRRAYQRKVAYAEFDAICSGDIYTFEADETRMLGEFLPFLVQSDPFFEHALDTSAGSLSPRTNWRDLADFEFELPPLDEQKRIADLLWAMEHRAAAQVACRACVAEVRHVWIDDQISRFLSADATAFADVWLSSPDSGYSAAPVDHDTGRYVLSLAALGPEGYIGGNLKNVPDTDLIRAAGLNAGDLLISRANTAELVGRVGIFPEMREDVSFPDTMMRLKLKSGVSNEFAAAVLGSPHGRAHMRRSAAGSATSMVKINRASLGRLRFPVVPKAAQEAFLAKLSRHDSALALLDSDLVAQRRLKVSIIEAVFGGN